MPPAPPPNPPEAPLDRDVPCQRCGYNLRGLFRSGRCPECGGTVELSLQGDLLKYADPKWVRKLVLGARIARSSALSALTLLALASVVATFYAFGDAKLGASVALIASVASPAACSIGLLIGALFVTTPHPLERTGSGIVPARLVSRIAGLIGIASLAVPIVWLAVGRPTPFGMMLLFAISPLGITGLVGACAHRSYLRHLGRRLPDTPLIDLADRHWRGFRIAWIVAATSAAVLVLLAKSLMTGSGIEFALTAACGIGLLFALPAEMVMGLHFLAVTGEVVRELQEARRHAEEAWNRAEDALR